MHEVNVTIAPARWVKKRRGRSAAKREAGKGTTTARTCSNEAGAYPQLEIQPVLVMHRTRNDLEWYDFLNHDLKPDKSIQYSARRDRAKA